MRMILAVVILFSALPPAFAGYAHNENFTVFTPAQPSREASNELAGRLIRRAEQLRKEIAEAWLGDELPAGVGKTTINVSFSHTKNSGLTWARENSRKSHMLYLTMTDEESMDTTLAHEMVHVVLATQFPGTKRLPAWIEEGIASRYDDDVRIKKRKQIIGWFLSTSNWPRIHDVVLAENISPDDPASYATSTTLVDYLLSRKDRKTLLAFASDCARRDIKASLQKHYGIRDMDELQLRWQRSLVEPPKFAGAAVRK